MKLILPGLDTTPKAKLFSISWLWRSLVAGRGRKQPQTRSGVRRASLALAFLVVAIITMMPVFAFGSDRVAWADEPKPEPTQIQQVVDPAPSNTNNPSPSPNPTATPGGGSGPQGASVPGRPTTTTAGGAAGAGAGSATVTELGSTGSSNPNNGGTQAQVSQMRSVQCPNPTASEDNNQSVLLPASFYAYALVGCGPAGFEQIGVALGMLPNEQVELFVENATSGQSIPGFSRPLRTQANEYGFVLAYHFALPINTPPGLYRMRFEGTGTGQADPTLNPFLPRSKVGATSGSGGGLFPDFGPTATTATNGRRMVYAYFWVTPALGTTLANSENASTAASPTPTPTLLLTPLSSADTGGSRTPIKLAMGFGFLPGEKVVLSYLSPLGEVITPQGHKGEGKGGEIIVVSETGSFTTALAPAYDLQGQGPEPGQGGGGNIGTGPFRPALALLPQGSEWLVTVRSVTNPNRMAVALITLS